MLKGFILIRAVSKARLISMSQGIVILSFVGRGNLPGQWAGDAILKKTSLYFPCSDYSAFPEFAFLSANMSDESSASDCIHAIATVVALI